MRMFRLMPLALVALGHLTACGGGPKPKPATTATPTPAPAPDPRGSTEIPKQKVDEPAPAAAADVAALLDAGRTAAAGGDAATAEARFREAIQAEPGFAEAHYNLAVLQEWAGRYDEARTTYEDALQARKTFGPAVVGVTNLLMRRGDAQGALRFAERAARNAPDSNGVANAVNHVRLAMGQHEKVIQDSKRILRRDERNVMAMKNLATAYARQGKHELAVAILKNAAKLSPDDPDIQYRQALSLLALKQKLKARLALEKATNLPAGATAEAYNNLGLIYHEAGDYIGAEAQFRKALNRWPDMLEARINLGNALKGQQKFGEADQALQAALRQSPSSKPALYNLAILYLDGQIPGVEPIARLERAIGYFGQYKNQVGSLPKDDPVEAYLAEAQKRLVVEKKRAEQMRNRPKAPPPPPPEEEGAEDVSADGEGSDDGEGADAPAEEAPAEEAPAEEAPAEEVSAEEVPAEEVPAEEIPSEDAPMDEGAP